MTPETPESQPVVVCVDCSAGRHEEDDEGNCCHGCEWCGPVEQTRRTGGNWWSLGYENLLGGE
jgi:hypothetical protein